MNKRITSLIQKLPENIDGALITSDVNRRYFCGMKSSAGIVVVFKDAAYLLIDFRYIEKARKTVTDCNVILLENRKKQLDELFEKHNAKRIAVESNTMTLSEYNSIKNKHCNIEFVGDDTLSDVLTSLRRIKTEDEITKIQKAQDIAENALERLMNDNVNEGVTEKYLSIKLNEYMLSDGAEDISFDTIVLFGENSSLPHGVPSDRKLKSGDNILIDFGAVFDGYHSDMTRTFCFGEPNDEFKEIYNIVLEAQKRGLEYAKSSIKGKDLDGQARNYIDEKGYGNLFGHSLGHGVGMEIHESPTVSSGSEAILENNSVVTIEPGIYIPQKFGVRIEDFVVLQTNKCINLTHFPKNLIVI